MKKKYLALLTAMVIAVAGVGSSLEVAAADFTSEVEETIPDVSEDSADATGAAYSGDYRYWSQGRSDYADMRAYGCWVVAQAKLLYETGVDRSASFNPDVYMNWQKNNGYLNSGFYQTNGGYAPVAYANQKGKNLEYLGEWTANTNQFWFNINAGYYTIIKVPGHYIYLDNQMSKSTGQLYCDDSYTNTNINSGPRLLSNYSSFLSCYVYKSNGNSSAISTDWGEWEDNITDNNACIYGKINVSQKVQFTGAGVNIWDSSNRLIKQYIEGTSVNYNYMQISYNLQTELGMTLSPGETYTYQMFADFGGNRYYGYKKTFKTTGQRANPSSGNTNSGSTSGKNNTGNTAGKTNTTVKSSAKLNMSVVPLKAGQKTSAVKVLNMNSKERIKSYKSSNFYIFTVSSKGQITAKKKGNATLIITLNTGKQLKATVKVQTGTVRTAKISIQARNKTLNRGKTYQIKTTVSPLTSQEKVVYSSSNKKVATVDSKGKVTARKKGTAYITVKSGCKNVKLKITVK